eukprot:300695_1
MLSWFFLILYLQFKQEAVSAVVGDDVIIKNGGSFVISRTALWITGNIATMNNEYFLVSYEFDDSNSPLGLQKPMYGEIYNVNGIKLNKESIILAPSNPNWNSTGPEFEQQSSLCHQCDYTNNNNNTVKNNLMYSWGQSTYPRSTINYRVIYPSTYDIKTNASYLNMSNFQNITDKFVKNLNTYDPIKPKCACLDNGIFVIMWDNEYEMYNTSKTEFLAVFDEYANKIFPSNSTQVASTIYNNITWIDDILACISYNENNIKQKCNTYLVISHNGYGWLYSYNIQTNSYNNLLKNQFCIAGNNPLYCTDGPGMLVMGAASLSNGLYGIIYSFDNDFYNLNITFYDGSNGEQLIFNTGIYRNSYSYKVNLDGCNVMSGSSGLFAIKQISISDNSTYGYTNYIAIIYSNQESGVGCTMYKVQRNSDDSVDMRLIGKPFCAYDDVKGGDIQSINLGSINNHLMISWQMLGGNFEANIFTVNLAETS